MDAIEVWELLAYIVTVFGLPFAMGIMYLTNPLAESMFYLKEIEHERPFQAVLSR